jgi:hypothetical protein
LENKFENNGQINTNLFPKGMQDTVDPRFMEQGQYLSAINAVLNSHEGDLYKIGNEPSTIKCSKIPYTHIGSIRLKDDRYVVFSTNDTDSEIGTFSEQECSYTTLVNSPCLNFSTSNLIKGVAQEIYDCTENVYWNDGLNPARVLNISNIPWVKTTRRNPDGGCDIEEDTTTLDCEALRLTPLLTPPNLSLVQGSGGTLPNGAYRIVIAYAVKKVRISDYVQISLPEFIYHHQGNQGSLSLTMTNLDRDFPQYQAILISTVNQQTTATVLGYYSTEQTTLHVDSLGQDDERIDLGSIPLQSTYYEGGEGMFKAGPYLVQTAVRTRKEFNYQPQASKIRAKWVAYAVPEDFYKKGGNKIGYTKGENLALAIRFVWNTGHRTQCFPLVGRDSTPDDLQVINNADSLAYGEGETVRKWEIYETGTITQTFPNVAAEHVAMEGEFGYHESSEPYPDNEEVWGDKACKPMQLFRWPSNCLVPNWDEKRKKILILGFKLENITYPLDENGNPIAGIVGYEILRTDKLGNKSIDAKGVIYNTGEYSLPSAFNETKKGLYPNYPLNDLRTDPFLSQRLVDGGCQGNNYRAVGTFKRDIFTFHSPETHFNNPTLGPIMKVEAEYAGTMNGYFEPVHRHPKAKLIRDFAFFISAMVGVGEGMLAISGKTTYTSWPTYTEVGATFLGTGAKIYKPLPMVSNLLVDTPLGALLGGIAKKGLASGRTVEMTANDHIPLPLRVANQVVLFSFYFGQGTEKTLEIIKRLVPYQQYAYQFNGEALYNKQFCADIGHTVRRLEDYSYLYPSHQEFQGYTINNRLRESAVVLKLNKEINNPKTQDLTRQTIGTLGIWNNPTAPFSQPTSAYYVAIKRKLASQYGQIDGWRLLPTSDDVHTLNLEGRTTSPVLFGGDTVVEEFTLKRKQSFFTQNAADGNNPNGFEFDYRLYPNIPYPRYWADTHEYDISQFFRLTNIKLPNDLHYLDRKKSDCNSKVSFVVKNGYFYLYSSAVVRFFVESQYHLPYRQNSTTNDEKKHYDKSFFTDLSTLFRSDVIEKDNHFEIDVSLSPIKQINFTYGFLQDRDYSQSDQKCFSYEPNKLIYSLPSNLENKRDTWRDFLTNNYFLFPKADGKISAIKEINRTGIMYLFESASAKMHSGVDQLETDSGIKITIGDGGLFARQPENISNSDFDLTECQSGNSVVSTQYGVFFISQKQGKIFQFAGQVKDISGGKKWWLSKYLPSRLLAQFPNFELYDNPVSGVGCMSIFDNTNEVVYFTKKDYKLKKEWEGLVSYQGGNEFLYLGRRRFLLGDPRYFDDASWTISYDPKIQAWVSYHDWHPDALIQGKRHFMAFKDSYIWKHNEATDSYCNFYGVDYPWEVELSYANPQQVTTLESVEYYLESYVYRDNDKHHIWDFNFDRAIIHNSEQCSGLLRLNARELNRPSTILVYPRFNATNIDIECTKHEQKYRFNQFADMTRNRGQINLIQRTIFVTEENGYKRQLNPLNLDYDKSPTQQKKFRHNLNKIILRRNVSGDKKMMLTLLNEKQNKSHR